MRPKATFMKKDFIIVLCCVVFLVMNLGIIAPGGRQQAKDAVCLSNLYKWGNVFQMYANDNNGSTISDPPWRYDPGIPGPESWIGTLYDYYKDKTLLLCPMALKPWYESGEWGGRYMAWYIEEGRTELPPDFDLGGLPFPGVIGSYGINNWCYNGPPDAEETWGYLVSWCWRSFNVKGAHNIPVFSDCLHIGAFAQDHDSPPELEDAPWTADYGESGLARYTMDRHGPGAINVLFMDFSAKAVGLKELWKLKWSREFDINGPWTIAGFGGDVEACAALWDAEAPWMSDFPEY